MSLFEQIDLPIAKSGKDLDLFHSPQFNVPVISRVPQVTTIHDCAYSRFPTEFSSPLDRCFYAIMFRLALQKSNKIIAVSQATKDDIQTIYGISGDKINVVHEGVDRSFLNDQSDVTDLKARFGVDQPFMLFVGISRPRKNLARILGAFAAAKDRFDKRMKLVIAGPEDDRFLNIRQLSRELKIDESVILLGRVTEQELHSLYRSARCLLFPTLYEGFGLPILEAMASGTPVLTSSMPAHMEIAGDAAVFVNPLDISEMGDAMAEIAENSGLRERLMVKGMDRARMFSWESCAHQTMAVYDQVLNG